MEDVEDFTYVGVDLTAMGTMGTEASHGAGERNGQKEITPVKAKMGMFDGIVVLLVL